MSQVTNPHPKLVQCRSALETVLNLTRNHAATICNKLEDHQVEAVLAAGDDKAKLQKVIEGKKPEAPKEEPKQESKPKR